MGIGADVMESDDSIGINQNVSAELSPIAAGFARPFASKDQFEVIPNGDWTINVPPRSSSHAVCVIQLLFGILKQRPRELGFFHIRQRHEVGIERDNFDFDVLLGQF